MASLNELPPSSWAEPSASAGTVKVAAAAAGAGAVSAAGRAAVSRLRTRKGIWIRSIEHTYGTSGKTHLNYLFDAIIGGLGDVEKELPKDAKLERLRIEILATDEWKEWNSATGDAWPLLAPFT
jgi:hypothetical protein